MKNIILLFLSLTSAVLPLNSAYARYDEPSRFMQAQPLPSKGPWFEGWYIRVTDHEMKRSFAVITTTSTHKKMKLKDSQILPGYVAFVWAPENSNETYSVERFPDQTQLAPTTDILWQDDNGGVLTTSSLVLRPDSETEVRLNLGGYTAWNRKNKDAGPAGAAGSAPVMPLHWFVPSLKTPVSYTVRTKQGTFQGTGYAHIEKNWGKAFPKAWMWAQGISQDGLTQVALAGGPLQIGPVNTTNYLVGVRGPGVNVSIHPGVDLSVNYKTKIDGCSGYFHLTAQNSKNKIVIESQAPPKSFVLLAIPTSKGYLPDLASESFYAVMNVTVYEHGRKIYETQIADSALEFGADNQCRN
jgi:hypothetical protein